MEQNKTVCAGMTKVWRGAYVARVLMRFETVWMDTNRVDHLISDILQMCQ